ncbi:hypothetical protein SNOUR_17515 [Streptomyces noursei ATCC 11455]|nr:hypothetical protein SNOUR_17515 [Streptomyces noursei ATCC 11455]
MGNAQPAHSEGPRNPSARGERGGCGALGFRCRRQGSAGTDVRRWGGGSAAGSSGWCGSVRGGARCPARALVWTNGVRGEGSHRKRSAVRQASSRMRLTWRNRFDRMRSVPGVPRTDHPIGVTGLLSPADRSRTGTRSHDADRCQRPASHRSGFPPVGRRLRVVLQAAPGWRGTGNNEPSRRPVTRRTGERAPELSSSRAPTRLPPGNGPRDRSNPASRPASSPAVRPARGTDLRPGPGRAPAGSSPARCPTGRAGRCSAPAPPSPGRGSAGARRRRSARVG